MTAAPDFTATFQQQPAYVRAGAWESAGRNGGPEFVEPSRAGGPSEDAKPVGAEDAAGPSTAAWQTIGANGRLREEGLNDSDRNYAICMHLSPLAFLWIGPFALAIPLVMWLMRKDQSRFADDHGREIVNFLMSLAVLHLALGITFVGLVLWPVMWVVAVVAVIRGSIAASRNEYFRYPVTIRFLT
jgi:uncharacterized Tic20 family protein